MTVIDPDKEWIYRNAFSASKSRNCPFDGWPMRGKAVLTIVGGRVVHEEI